MKNRFFILLQYCLPQHGLTRLCASLANCQTAWFKRYFIRWFIKRYQIDISLAQQSDIEKYPCFNAFFIRQLREDTRPLAANGIVSPADGCLSQFGKIDAQTLIQAKGKYFKLKSLLVNDQHLINAFYHGEFATIYLSPRDYHRVHMPCDGKLVKTIYVPGKLFSVNQTTAQHVDNLFARNERLICVFETEYGLMLQILVGAMLVAGMHTVWGGDVKRCNTIQQWSPTTSIELQRGQEMGYFNFGSTVITLFQASAITWEQHYCAGDMLQVKQKLAS